MPTTHKTIFNALLALAFFCVLPLSGQVQDRFERKKKPVAEDPPVQEATDPASTSDEGSSARREAQDRKNKTGKGDKPESDGGFSWDKLRWGGAFGASFGNFTYVMLNPRVAYHLDEQWTLGLGLTYIYSKDDRTYTRSINNGAALEQSVFGVNPFANYELFSGLGIGTEFDLVRADIILSNPYNTGSTPFVIERDWVPHWFVGATYYPRDQGVFAGIYYNLLDDGRSFYSNPEIRFGFFF